MGARAGARARALRDSGNPITSDPIAAGKTFNVANTNVLFHGGRLLALEEGNPFELERGTLASIGPYDFGGALEGPMTAHPKIDPETGEMLFFGYNVGGMGHPTMSYQVVAKDGRLTRSDRFEAPYASMVHDFLATRNFVVFPTFPATTSLERAMKGGPPIAWDPSESSRFGFLRRSDPIDAIHWVETEACFVYHPMNAFEDGDRIVADMVRYDGAPGFPTADGDARILDTRRGDSSDGPSISPAEPTTRRSRSSTTSSRSSRASTSASPGSPTATAS